jgi:thiamine-phosphate pyrophosphorylase
MMEYIHAAISSGVGWIQIREKDLSAKPLLALARKAVEIARSSAPIARIFVNDRLDVALAANSAGIHLSRESMPIGAAVQWCQDGNAPSDFRFGASCHGVEEAKLAESLGADYVFWGPVFDTPEKRKFGEPQGIGRLAEVCHHVSIPVIAIGGINEENAEECLRAGAAGVAAIRLFQEPRDPSALSDLLSRLQTYR